MGTISASDGCDINALEFEEKDVGVARRWSVGNLPTGEVLIVDHNVEAVEFTVSALRACYPEITIDVLQNGEQALYYVFRAGVYVNRDSESPRVILLEIDVPGVPGIEVLQRLKRDRQSCEIPIVVLSGCDEPQTIRRCYELGANGVVRKPTDIQRYLAQIQAMASFWLDWNITSRLPRAQPYSTVLTEPERMLHRAQAS